METITMNQKQTPDKQNAADPFDLPGSQCILCGKCLEVCPLFAATEREELSPRAKFHLARFITGNPQALDRMSASKLAELCLCCGRCEKACPQGLCAPHLAAGLRAMHPDMTAWMWRQWIRRGRILWPAAMATSGLAPKSLRQGRLETAFSSLEALKSGGIAEPWLSVTHWDDSAQAESVVLFPGCVASNVRANWTKKAEAVLENLGYTLQRRPKWQCCAATMGHAGLMDVQLTMQRANLEAWRKAGRPKIVTFCATCLNGLTSYAQVDALGWEEGEQDAWLAALTPLATLWGESEFAVNEDKAPEIMHFHTPCHDLGGGDLEFLARAVGERLGRASKDQCCGMGGIMQLTEGGLTGQVASHCWEFFAAGEGEELVTSCSGCVTQLAATAPPGVSVGHWLEIVEI